MSTKQKVDFVFYNLCDSLIDQHEEILRLVAKRIVAMCEKCARDVRS